MKKIISVILLLSIVFGCVTCVIPLSSAASDGADIPVIHVCGYGALLVKDNANGKKETIYPLQVSDGYIEEKAKEFLPVFAKAFFTQEWSEFCEVLVDILAPVFEPIALDNNGEASNGSRADWTWSRKTLRDKMDSAFSTISLQAQCHFFGTIIQEDSSLIITVLNGWFRFGKVII